MADGRDVHEGPQDPQERAQAAAHRDLPAAGRHGRRGSRFAQAHQRRAHLHRLHPVRLWRLLLGLALLAFGIVNIFIPGPGGSVIILSSLLILAGESRRLAATLDELEVRFAPQVDWALEHKLAAIVVSSGAAFLAVSTLTFAYLQVR